MIVKYLVTLTYSSLSVEITSGTYLKRKFGEPWKQSQALEGKRWKSIVLPNPQYSKGASLVFFEILVGIMWLFPV